MKMKKITTIVTEEFNENGEVISRTTKTTVESDDGYICPQYQYRPIFQTIEPFTATTRYEQQCRNRCD